MCETCFVSQPCPHLLNGDWIKKIRDTRKMRGSLNKIQEIVKMEKYNNANTLFRIVVYWVG